MLTFTYDEDMMSKCLCANGWSNGWDSTRWVHNDMKPDYGDYSLKEAFEYLMVSKNVYGKQWNYGWEDAEENK